MNLLQTIDNDLKKALKAKDADRVSVLRMLKSSIHNKEIEVGKELSDEEIGEVVGKETRSREESVAEYKKGNRPDLVESEEKEIEILKTYLPEQLSDNEIEKIVDEVIADTGASSLADIGKVMGQVMPKLSGKADGAKVSEIVKNKLPRTNSA